MASTALLTARVELADAIVVSQRAQRDKYVADGRDAGLIAGAEAGLERVSADAARLRAELKARA